jgi:O-antigen ligase
LSIGRVLATVLILLPLVSLYARQQIVGLMVIGAIVALAAVRIGKPQPKNRWAGVDPWPAIAFLLFAAWGALSLIWSIDVGRSAGVLGKLVGISLAGFVFALAARRSTAADRRLISAAAVIAAAVSVAIIIFEALLDLALIKWLWPMLGQTPPERLVYLNFPLLVMSGLVPLGALFAILRGWWWLAPPLYAAALTAALQLESATSTLSLLVSGIALPLFACAPRWFGDTAAAFALVMGLLFIPVAGKPLSTFRPALETVERFGDSARHRLAIWGALSGKLGDRPVGGIGLGAIRSMPQAGQFIDVPRSKKSVKKLRVDLIPMHPHNAGIEIGLELGAVGLALALFLVVSILRTARNMATTRWQGAGIAALACAIAATSMMALSIWNYAYLSAWLIIFASLAGGSGRGSTPQPS